MISFSCAEKHALFLKSNFYLFKYFFIFYLLFFCFLLLFLFFTFLFFFSKIKESGEIIVMKDKSKTVIDPTIEIMGMQNDILLTEKDAISVSCSNYGNFILISKKK